MPIPPKPKRLTIGPLSAPSLPLSDDVVTARRRTWAGWLDECVDIQDAFVEGLLANLPGHD